MKAIIQQATEVDMNGTQTVVTDVRLYADGALGYNWSNRGSLTYA